MQIITDETKKEIKAYGSHTLPLLASYKKITVYDSGSFLWYWYPKIRMTLIISGEMLYRTNHQEYHVRKEDALFCNVGALHAGTMYHEQDCTYTSVAFDSRFLFGFEGSLVHRKYVKPFVSDLPLSLFCSNGSVPWHSATTVAIQHIALYDEEKADAYELATLTEPYTILEILYPHMHSARKLPTSDMLNYDRIRTILLYVKNNYNREFTLHDIVG